MSSLIQSHFEKILKADPAALEDYGNDVTCIVRAGGLPQTTDAPGLKGLMKQVLARLPFEEAEILVNRTTDTCGVLTLKSPFSPFTNYVCIGENGKIKAVTLYIYQCSESLKLVTAPIPECREADRIFGKHFRAMFSVSANVISKDYAENGVVITNMAKGVCNGKAEIFAFCDHLMKNCWALLRKMNFHGITSARWKVLSAGDGLLQFTIEAPKMGMVMNESYYVKDGKVQFESAIADGAMLELVHQMLD